MTTTILTLIFILSAAAFSQQQNPQLIQPKLDSMQREINELKENTDNEFSKKIYEEVKKQFIEYMGELVKTFGVIISVAIGILGFFGIKIGADTIRSYVGKRVKEMAEVEYRKINKNQSTFIIEQRLDSIERKYTTYLMRLEAEKEINGILQEIIAINDELFIEKMLGKIIRYYYVIQYYEAISKLAYEYGDKYNLDEVTWTNIALSNFNMYSLYGSVVYRNQTIDACNKSLKKNPIYEEPIAVLIIVYCIHIQESDAEVRKNVISELRKLINNVNSGTSEFVSYNVLERLVQRGKKYLPLIKQELSKGYDLLIERANKYCQTNKLPLIEITVEADTTPVVTEVDKTVPHTT